MTEKYPQSHTKNESQQEPECLVSQQQKQMNALKITRKSTNESHNVAKEIDEKIKRPSDSIVSKKNEKIGSTKSLSTLNNRSIYGTIDYPEGYRPAIIHANFDRNRQLIDPARPLTDIPEPAPRSEYLSNLYKDIFENQIPNDISKWELIKSSSLAEYLDFLLAANLIKLPISFYRNNSTQPILTTINDLKIIDMSEIKKTIDQLSRDIGQVYQSGFCINPTKVAKNQYLPVIDEIHSKEYLSEWESILYPDRYDKGETNLQTDVIAVSVAVHALSQCGTRKSINYKLPASEIIKYLRSYLLSQCTLLPHKREQIKNISLYEGHVIIASQLLGWDIEVVNDEGRIHVFFNISSRSGLFTRYPILSDYYVNGWE